MRVVDLIEKKRDGGSHSREELEAIVGGYVRGGEAIMRATLACDELSEPLCASST